MRVLVPPGPEPSQLPLGYVIGRQQAGRGPPRHPDPTHRSTVVRRSEGWPHPAKTFFFFVASVREKGCTRNRQNYYVRTVDTTSPPPKKKNENEKQGSAVGFSEWTVFFVFFTSFVFRLLCFTWFWYTLPCLGLEKLLNGVSGFFFTCTRP